MIKKVFVILFVIATLFCLTGTLFACKEDDGENVEEEGYDMTVLLHTEGRVIKNAKSETVTLRGVNLGGWLIQERWMCPTDFDNGYFEVYDTFTERFGTEESEALIKVWEDNYIKEEDFDNIKALGLNAIRLPFTWRNLQNTDYTYKENAFSRLDWAIEQCVKRELYVVIDLHGAHGSQNGRHHSGYTKGELYSSEENMALTEELWVRIATRYKDNPWIAGYDLLNEPENQPEGKMTRVQKNYHKRLYKAIRAVDPTHIIMMEAVWEPTVMPNPETEGFVNVVYEYHFYGWSNTDDAEVQKAFTDSKIELLEYSFGSKVPCFVGEFTYFSQAESWEYSLDVYNREGWSWTVWTYKVNGTGSSWGLYTGETERVNPQTDSFDEIVRKWSAVNTQESYEINGWLTDIVKKYA